MNDAYEKFEEARVRFENAPLWSEKHLAALPYLDAAIAALHAHQISTVELNTVWQQVKRYISA